MRYPFYRSEDLIENSYSFRESGLIMSQPREKAYPYNKEKKEK